MLTSGVSDLAAERYSGLPAGQRGRVWSPARGCGAEGHLARRYNLQFGSVEIPRCYYTCSPHMISSMSTTWLRMKHVPAVLVQTLELCQEFRAFCTLV